MIQITKYVYMIRDTNEVALRIFILIQYLFAIELFF